MIDKRPRMIARCVDVADVITAVNFGREQRLLIAIRGGGSDPPNRNNTAEAWADFYDAFQAQALKTAIAPRWS